ncbi:unnamed protein product, partial [Rotaria magnacalcarata]
STTDEVIITTDGMLSTTDKVISTTTSMITSMVSGNTIDFQRSITILLQHQQQVQKLLLQQQRRQKEPQRRLRPQPLRQRQLQQRLTYQQLVRLTQPFQIQQEVSVTRAPPDATHRVLAQVECGCDLLVRVVPLYLLMHRAPQYVAPALQDGTLVRCQVLAQLSVEHYATSGLVVHANGRVQFK